MRSGVIFATLLSFIGFNGEAFAQKPNDCVGIAAALANAGQREIDGWLARYHQSYHNCVLSKKTAPEKAASYKRALTKPVATPAKVKPIRKKDVPHPAAESNSKMIKMPDIPNVLDPGRDSWTKNCTQRYGSFSKDSEFYITSSGRRAPCSMFRDIGHITFEKFLVE